MNMRNRLAAIGLGFLLMGCAAMPDIASRNAPFEAQPPATGAALAAQPAAPRALPLRVTGMTIRVPETLSVSEANLYYPRGDIVWRGDPIGDRHAQVKAIFEDGFGRGVAPLAGDTDVTIDVQVIRFHSLSEKARYTIGGVHNIVFYMTVHRADTGEPLGPTRRIESDLEAFGGKAAIEADRIGQTQKVRVTDHLARLIRRELARYVAA